MRIKNRGIFFALSLSLRSNSEKRKANDSIIAQPAHTSTTSYVLPTTSLWLRLCVWVQNAVVCYTTRWFTCIVIAFCIYTHDTCCHASVCSFLKSISTFMCLPHSKPFRLFFFPILLNSLFDLMPYRIPSIRFTCWKLYTAYAVANSHCMRHEHSHKMCSCNFLDNFGFVWKKQKKKKREHK